MGLLTSMQYRNGSNARFEKISQFFKESWIGNNNAFQLPIYYWIFKTITNRKTINIELSHVLEEVEKS